jgi:hypothetical protein
MRGLCEDIINLEFNKIDFQGVSWPQLVHDPVQ